MINDHINFQSRIIYFSFIIHEMSVQWWEIISKDEIQILSKTFFYIGCYFTSINNKSLLQKKNNEENKLKAFYNFLNLFLKKNTSLIFP